jgi:hypothetical protein
LPADFPESRLAKLMEICDDIHLIQPGKVYQHELDILRETALAGKYLPGGCAERIFTAAPTVSACHFISI